MYFYFSRTQVCLKGHIITHHARNDPEFDKKFCSVCGQPTITSCPECGQPIQGYSDTDFHSREVINDPPSYCHACGKAFPWCLTKIEAAKELIEELENVTDQEKEKVISGIPDIMGETPKTQLAATRLEKLLQKAQSTSGPIVQALRAWSVDVASETAKKIISGQ